MKTLHALSVILMAALLFAVPVTVKAQSSYQVINFGTVANAITGTQYLNLTGFTKVDSVVCVLVDKAQNINVDSLNFYPGVSIPGLYEGANGSYSTSVTTQISTLAAVGNQLLLTTGATPLTAAVLRGYNFVKVTMAGSPTGNT